VSSKEITKNLLKNRTCENCSNDCAPDSSHGRAIEGTCKDWRKWPWWISPSKAIELELVEKQKCEQRNRQESAKK
jgi:hypothetical protein